MNTITLKTPIERRSKATGAVVDRVDELTFRPLIAGDLVEAINASDNMANKGSFLRALVCLSCGLSAADFDALSMEDGMAVMARVSDFLPAGPPTGKTG
jgi:hypothetical protein